MRPILNRVGVLRHIKPTFLLQSRAKLASHTFGRSPLVTSAIHSDRIGQIPEGRQDKMELGGLKEPKSLKYIENFLNSWLKPSLYGESWDNIGLLIGSGHHSKKEKMVSTILVCNDLTTAVTNEAIQIGAQLIIAYHPPIFTPMKRIGFGWKDSIVSKCLARDISVYSPHTMLDSIPYGINDSIIQMLCNLSPSREDFHVESVIPNKSPLAPTREVNYMIQTDELTHQGVTKLVQALQAPCEDNDVSFSINLLQWRARSEIGLSFFFNHNQQTHTFPDLLHELASSWGFQESIRDITPPGAGRVIKFKTGKTMLNIQQALQVGMQVKHLKVADTGKNIYSVAVCAGSGGSLLADVDVDLIITGELSHHEVLHCFESGKSVILCGHANSERHYLPILADILGVLLNCPNIQVSKCDTGVIKWV